MTPTEAEAEAQAQQVNPNLFETKADFQNTISNIIGNLVGKVIPAFSRH
jgi:hypothetical protein